MGWFRSESVRVGLFATAVAVPLLLVVVQMDAFDVLALAMPPAAGVAAGLCWWWLGARRPRVGLGRAAAVGLLAGVLFHFILWAALVPPVILTTHPVEPFEQAVPAWFGEPILDGISMWFVFSGLSLLFGGVVSVPAGVLGAILYVLWTRRHRRRGGGPPSVPAGGNPRDGGPAA